MRLPNKLGTVFKVSGRRNPWRAVSAYPERKNVGYFPTRDMAIKALYEYRESNSSDETFLDVYNHWSREHYPKIKRTEKYVGAFRRSAPLYKMKMRDIRLADLERTVENSDAPSEMMKSCMKQLYHALFQYAMARDIAEKDYSAFLHYQVKPPRSKTVFSHEEIDALFADGSDIAKIILIGIFSGWRPSELLAFEIEGDYMIGGSKTEAGIDRVVPIHPIIKDIINVDRNETYETYRGKFKRKMRALGMNHRPHETRHTFITLAKESGMNDNVLKQIVGHKGDLTERVYTHRRKEVLYDEMKKVTY